ncbi:MAG TPA: hypothetical protein VFB79_00225 [Candidatus Angelobacter sp.]|nr:hypothetical protein [Candidatus Angelobacter sp.]
MRLYKNIIHAAIYAGLVCCASFGVGQSNQEDKPKLQPPLLLKGIASDGVTILSLDIYKVENGITVGVSHATFKSNRGAQNEFASRLKHTDIVSRREQKNGKRAVVTYLSASGEEISAILWTDGMDFYGVSSSSLEVAKQVEQEILTATQKN